MSFIIHDHWSYKGSPGGREPISAGIRQAAVYTQENSPVYCRVDMWGQTTTHTLAGGPRGNLYSYRENTQRDPSPTGSRTLLCLFFQHKKSQPLCSKLCVYANKYIYVSSRSVKNVVVLVHRSFAHTSFLEKKKWFLYPYFWAKNREQVTGVQK